MPKKPQTIGDRIRCAAKKAGLRIESFRREHRMSNTPFYDLLADKLPAKVATREKWKQQLEAAGVRVGKAL